MSGCGVHYFHLLRYICSLSTCVVSGRFYLSLTGLQLRNFMHDICGHILFLCHGKWDLFNKTLICVFILVLNRLHNGKSLKVGKQL